MNQDFSAERLADDLDKLADDYPAYLQRQPAKNIKTLLIQIKPQLDRLRAGGASYQQIHQILINKGVKVSIYTIRLYLADLFRNAPPAPAFAAPPAPKPAPVSKPAPPKPAPPVASASPKPEPEPEMPASVPIRRALPEIPPAPSTMPSGKGWRSSSAQIDGDLI